MADVDAALTRAALALEATIDMPRTAICSSAPAMRSRWPVSTSTPWRRRNSARVPSPTGACRSAGRRQS